MIWQKVERLIYSSISTDARQNPRQHTNPHHHQALYSNISLVLFFKLNIFNDCHIYGNSISSKLRKKFKIQCDNVI